MVFSLFFMSMLLSLNSATNIAPQVNKDSVDDSGYSSETYESVDIDENLLTSNLGSFNGYADPTDGSAPIIATAPAVSYHPTTTFNRHEFFANLKDYSPINNIGSCGYVSLIQLMSFYDTFYNDSVIPEQYERKKMDATTEAQVKTQSPGVVAERWSSTSYTSYFAYCNGTMNDNLQSRLTVLNNNINGTNSATNFAYSIGGWSYQNMLNTFYGNTETVNVITSSDKTQAEYIQIIKDAINEGDPVVVHVNHVGDNGGGHSVVAYDYDESGIYAHYGWGGSSSTYRLFNSYNQIYYVARLDYSSLKHSHSNNYIINGKGYCGCNLSDEVKILSGGDKTHAPVLYWMDDLYNPSSALVLIKCKKTFNILNPLMITGFVFLITSTNSVSLSQAQWDAIWALGGHNYTVTIQRISALETYNPSSTTLNFLGITSILNLNVSDYGFAQHYVPNNVTKQITKNGITFTTNRLRCGHINDTGLSQTGEWYTVISANKAGAGTAYLSYDFDFDFNMIDIDLSFWAYGEGLYSSNGTARIEYKTASGEWATDPALDLLNDVTLPCVRTNPTTYTVSFPEGTRSFRIISTVNNPSGSNNRARICIGDLSVYNR